MERLLNVLPERTPPVTPEEAKAYVKYQLGALMAFTQSRGIRLQHVKPHGAMYNMAAVDEKLALAMCEAVYEVDKDIIFMGLAGSKMIGVRVLVGDAEVAHKREVERLAEGRGLLVRDVVRDGRDVEVFLLLLGVGLMLGKVLGAAGVVLDPLGDALRDGLARHVVVAAAHAEDAVITGLAEGLGDLLVAQLDYSVEAVFQRNVVVDDLTSLRESNMTRT